MRSTSPTAWTAWTPEGWSLAGTVGYVGALGSRHTQAARAQSNNLRHVQQPSNIARLQIEDPKLRDFADKSMPRLRAAYVQTIQVYAAGMPPGSEPNVDFIVQALQRQTDLVLKRPGAKLLIGAVVAN